MSQKLLFINPELRDGVQTTVRLSDSWMHRARPGDVLDVCRTGDEETVLARVVVMALMLCRFIHLPAEVFQTEHDKDCRSVSGLYAALTRAYGTVLPTDLVTVIYFKQVPEA